MSARPQKRSEERFNKTKNLKKLMYYQFSEVEVHLWIDKNERQERSNNIRALNVVTNVIFCMNFFHIECSNPD